MGFFEVFMPLNAYQFTFFVMNLAVGWIIISTCQFTIVKGVVLDALGNCTVQVFHHTTIGGFLL
jgi:hypothetical protein